MLQLRQVLFPEGALLQPRPPAGRGTIYIQGQVLSAVRGVQRPKSGSPHAVRCKGRVALKVIQLTKSARSEDNRKLTCFGKIGEISHNSFREVDLLRRIGFGGVQRLSENVINFLRVHDSRPRRPRISYLEFKYEKKLYSLVHSLTHRSMFVIIHINVVPSLCVPMRELVDVAGELVVAHHLVQGVPIGHRVVGIQPIGVLENDGLTRRRTDVRVQFRHCSKKFLSAIKIIPIKLIKKHNSPPRKATLINTFRF